MKGLLFRLTCKDGNHTSEQNFNTKNKCQLVQARSKTVFVCTTFGQESLWIAILRISAIVNFLQFFECNVEGFILAHCFLVCRRF